MGTGQVDDSTNNDFGGRAQFVVNRRQRPRIQIRKLAHAILRQRPIRLPRFIGVGEEAGQKLVDARPHMLWCSMPPLGNSIFVVSVAERFPN